MGVDNLLYLPRYLEFLLLFLHSKISKFPFGIISFFWRTCFSISFILDVLVKTFLSFPSSEDKDTFILSLILRNVYTVYIILCCSFFCHSTLKMFHYLLVSIVASKKSVIIQILVLLYTMSFFRLLLRFALALIFSSLITVHLDIQFFECFLVAFCWVSQISKFTPFTNLGMISTFISSIFFYPTLFLLPFWHL